MSENVKRGERDTRQVVLFCVGPRVLYNRVSMPRQVTSHDISVHMVSCVHNTDYTCPYMSVMLHNRLWSSEYQCPLLGILLMTMLLIYIL